MAAQHAVGFRIDDQLHQCALLIIGQGQLHRPETTLENLHIVTGLDCIFFGQTDRTDVRQTEYRRRDVIVVYRAILLGFEQSARDRHAFSQRDRGQLHTSDDVADGQDGRFAALVMLIDLDVTVLVQLDVDTVQTEVVEHRPTPCCIEHAIGLERAAALHGQQQTAIGLLVDALDIAVEANRHVALEQLFMKMGTNTAIKPTQKQFATVDQRGVGAQAVEDRSELHGNIATAHDHYALWQRLEVKRLVGRNGMLASWHIRHLRPATGGDQNALDAVGLAVDFDLLRPDDLCMAFKQGNAAVDQQFTIDAVEAADLTVLVGNQRGPVKTGLAQ